MYADRANMILMTGFLITGMITVPIALIILWHLHSKKRRELKMLKENLRYRNMYPNYMVPPGSAHESTRMYATMEGPYDPQRWPSAPTDPDHWQSMRMMLGSRDQPTRQLGATTGPAAAAVNDSFVLGNSGQFVGPIYRGNIIQPNNQGSYPFNNQGPTYNPMLAMQMSNCQMHQPIQGGAGLQQQQSGGAGLQQQQQGGVVVAAQQGASGLVGQTLMAQPQITSNGNTPNASETIYTQQQWRPVICQQPQQQNSQHSVPGSTGSLDWVQNMNAVPRQIDGSLDHANTIGGCGHLCESEVSGGDKADTVNSQQTVIAPPLHTKKIPASQLAS